MKRFFYALLAAVLVYAVPVTLAAQARPTPAQAQAALTDPQIRERLLNQVKQSGLSPDQIRTRGAVAQPRESPAGVPVPFEPAADPSLASLSPARAKGTDIAIAGTDIHAVWTTNTGSGRSGCWASTG